MTKQAAHVDSIDLLVVDVESSLGELLLPGIKALQVAFIVAHKPALQHSPLIIHSFIHSFIHARIHSLHALPQHALRQGQLHTLGGSVFTVSVLTVMCRNTVGLHGGEPWNHL